MIKKILFPTKRGYRFTILNRAILAFVVFMCIYKSVNAANYFSRATGNWTSNTTWSASSGGSAVGVGVFPVAGDNVTIEGGFNVTLTANAACASVTFTAATATSLTISTFTLAVSGAITIPRAGASINQVIVGAGRLNVGSVAFTSGGGTNRHQITISTGTVTVTGSITQTGSTGSATIVMTGAGLLQVGGAFLTAGTGTFAPAGGTFEYNGSGAQTIQTWAYRSLKLSGGNTKTLAAATPTVNGALTVSSLTTLALSTFTLGATTPPTSLVMDGGSTTGASITGTGALRLGGNVTINDVTTGTSGATISCPVILTGTRTFTVADDGTTAADLTISSIISGAFGVTKAGAGTMVLSGLNTYTGTTLVSSGILRASTNNVTAGAAGAFGNNASGLQLGGGTIQSNVTTFSRPITVTVTNSGIDAYGSSRTISSTITLGTAGTFNLNIGGTTAASAEGQALILSGVISNTPGTLNITKIGTSSVTLSGTNTYTGTTTISDGSLIAGAAAPSGSNGVFGNSTSTLTLGDANTTTNGSSPSLLIGGAFNIARTVTIANQATTGTYSIGGSTAAVSILSGAITLNQPLSITAVASGTVQATGTVTANSKKVTKIGAGTFQRTTSALSLSGDFEITSGTFNPNALATTITGLTTISGGTYLGTSAIQTFNGALTVSGGVLTASTGTIVATNVTVSSGTLTATSSTFSVTGNWSNTGGTFTHNSGTVAFSGTTQSIGGSSTSTFNNLTIVSGSTTSLAVNTSIAGTLTVAGTYDLNAFTSNRTAASGTMVVSGTLLLSGTTGGQTGSNFPTNFSVMTLTGGTVNYDNASGGQTIYNTPTYATLGIGNSSGTQTAGGVLNCTNLATTLGGTLDMVTFSLTATTPSGQGTINTQNTGTTPLPAGKTWAGNVNYNAAGNQTVINGAYSNLFLSNSGNKVFSTTTFSITAVLSIATSVKADLGSVTSFRANTLILGGSSQASGTWGSTSSGATNQSNTWFLSPSTGRITITVSGCANSTAATLSGTASICNGNSTNLAVAVTGGTSPYTVLYSDGASTFTLSSYTSGSTFSVSPTTTKTYSLTSVTSTGGCIGTGLSGTPTVTVNNASTASVLALSGASNICFGSSTTFSVAITGGTSPFTLNYTDGASTFTVTSYTSGSSFTITPTATKTYTLTSVTSTGGCSGTGLSGNPTVTVTPLPTVSVGSPLSAVCQGAGTAALGGSVTSPATGGTWSDNGAGGTFANATNLNTTYTTSVSSVSTVTLTLTSSGGSCGTAATSKTLIVNPTITPSLSLDITNGSNPTCINDAIEFTATPSNTGGGTVNYAFYVNGGSPVQNGALDTYLTSSLANNDVVTCSITVSGGACLSTTVATDAPITMTVNPLPQGSLTANGPFCTSGTAQLTFTKSAGTEPFSIDYDEQQVLDQNEPTASSGVAFAAFTNPITTTTTYTLISVTDANSCSRDVGFTSAAATVTVNPTPNVVQPSNQTICNGSTLSVTFTGSVTATYSWTNSNTAIGIASSGSGNISTAVTNTTTAAITATFTVTPSASGCTGSAKTFTITVNPTPVVNQPSSQTICNGATLTTVFTGSASPTFGWTNSNTAIGVAASGSGNISTAVTNTTTAAITATFTVTPSANGCTGSAKTYTVTVNPTPTVTQPSNQTICNGATLTVNYTGAVSGTTFSWTNSNTAIGIAASGSGNISTVVTNTTAVAITASFTVTPSANGCTGSAKTYTVTVNPTPTVTQPSNQTLCNGTTLTVNYTGAVSGTTFSWTNSNTAIGIAASGSGNISTAVTNTTSAAITATFTVTPNANTCTGSAKTYTVTVNPTPTVTQPSNQTLCNGTTLTVTYSGAVSGTTFSWTNSNTTIGIASSGSGNISTAVTNTTTAAITATFTVTPSANSCTGSAQTYTITVNPTPTVTQPSNQTLCNGATLTVNYTGSVSGTTFSWTNSNTAIGIAASGSGNISTAVTNTTSAAITATFTVTPNANGCGGSAKTFTVTVNPTPTVTQPSNQTLCTGNTLTVNYTGAVSGATFSWTNSNTAIGVSASGSGNISTAVTNTTSTTAVATFTVTPSANGCAGSVVTYTISVNPVPTTSNAGSNQTICISGVTLSANTPSVGSGSWSIASGPSTNTSQFSSLSNPAAVFTPSGGVGTYNLVWTISNSPCTASTSTVTLTVVSTGTWFGITNDWFTASNWCGGVPTSSTNVTIPSGVSFMPTIGSSGAACNNITINSGATLTLNSTAALSVFGDWTNNGTVTNTAGTITFAATTTGKTIAGTLTGSSKFNHLIFNGVGGAWTFSASAEVAGDFTITNGTVTAPSNTLTVTGNWTNNGTFTNNSGTVNLNGASAQSYSGATTFNNLTISNSAGVNASSDLTVNGILNLSVNNPSSTKGSLDFVAAWNSYPVLANYSSSTLFMGASATTVGLGDVTGLIRRNTIVANTSYSFGNENTNISLTTGTMPSSMTVIVKIGSVPPGKTDAIQRHYEILPPGGSGCFLTGSFHYLDAELNGNTETNLTTWDYDIGGGSSTPDEHGRASFDFTNNHIGLANIPISYFIQSWRTLFTLGEFQAGYKTWNGSVSTDWNNSANWSPFGVPSTLSFIIIPDASTTSNDAVLPTGSTTINTMEIQAGGILVMGSNTIVINNTLSGGWEDQNPSGNDPGTSTVIFAATGASISGTSKFYNVEIADGASITLEVDGTMKIGNTITRTGSGTGQWFADVNDGTVEYYGSSQTVLQTDATPSYHHLILSGSGTKTLPTSTLDIHGSLILSGTVSVSPTNILQIGADLQIGSGTTFASGSSTHTVGGIFNNNGTFSAGSGTIALNGTLTQTISGTSSITFNNLTINNSLGVLLTQNGTINGQLTLSSGRLDIETNTLTFGISASSVGGSLSSSNMIVSDGGGEVRKTATNASEASYTFPVGDGISSSNGAEYSPISLTFSSGSYSGYVGIKVNNSKHPNNANTNNYLNRYWSISSSGITSASYSLTASYTSGDVSGSDANISTGSYAGSLPWSKYTGANTGSKVLSATGLINTNIDISGITTAAPTVSITGSGAICNPSTITLGTSVTGDPTVSYVWSTTATTSTVSVSPTSTTGYTVTVTDGNGFTGEGTATVSVSQPPTTSVAGSNQTICSVGAASLSANTPSIGVGSWSVASGPSTSIGQLNSTSSNTATFTPAGGVGTYALVWTISNSPCTASTSTVTITVVSSNMWLGTTDNDWYNSSNWCGGVPSSTSDIIIPSGTPFSPEINAYGATCKDIVINSGATFTITVDGQLSVKGSWTNNGTFTSSEGEVDFDGTTTQTITGGTTFGGLVLDNTSGLTLNNDISLASYLYIANGVVSSNGNLVTIENGASAGADNGYVDGEIKQYVIADMGISASYPVGSNGSYSGLDLNIDNVSSAGYITVGTTHNDHPAIGTSGFSTSTTVNRYWTITNNSATITGNYSVGLTYQNGDVDSGVDQSSLGAKVYDGVSWTDLPSTSNFGNYEYITDIANFGSIQLGEINPSPELYSISPSSGSQGATLNVTFTGAGYVSGVSQLDAVAGITTNSITVTNANELIANISISPSATLGTRNFTISNGTPGGGTSTAMTFSVITSGPIANFNATSVLVRCKTDGTAEFNNTSSNATSYVWNFGSGATPSTYTTTTTTPINVSYSTTGLKTISLTATNGVSSNTMTKTNYVTVSSSPPLAVSFISGPTLVCSYGTSPVSYQAPSTTGATGYTWTVPTGASIVTGQGTTGVTISYSTGFTSGNITVKGTNGCGNGTAATLQVIKKPLTPGTISGPTLTCGLTTASYTIAPVLGATTYSWGVPVGCSITSGQGTTSMTASLSANVTGNITVTADNICTSSNVQSLSIIGTPATPSSLAGPTSVCNAGTVNYFCANVTSATSYNWTVPSGMSITAGNGTTGITVSVTPSTLITGSITVTTTNACTAGVPKTLAINSSPATAGTIVGLTNICSSMGTPVTYSIATALNATDYQWLVPAGASVTGGQGTNIAQITFNSSFAPSAKIILTVGNACATNPTKSIIVSKAPASILDINGNAIVCPTTTETYSVTPVLGATSYNWVVPAGTSIASGQGTTQLTLNIIGVSSGVLKVAPVNACFTGAFKSVTLTACASPMFRDIESGITNGVVTSIYPNPTVGNFTIEVNSEKDKDLIIEVYDALGNVVINKKQSIISGTTTMEMNIDGHQNGLYFIRINDTTNTTLYSGTMIKQ